MQEDETKERKELAKMRNIIRDALELTPFEEEFYDLERRELRPLTHITETGDDFTISVDMPCVRKENIDVKSTENNVTISAKMTECVRVMGYDEREIEFEQYKQNVKLPGTVDPTKAKASFKNGVLTIRLPKKTHGSSVSIE